MCVALAQALDAVLLTTDAGLAGVREPESRSRCSSAP